MGDFFQQHKRFILGYVGGFFAFVILYLLVGSIFGGDTRGLERQIRRYKADIRSKPRNVKIGDLRLERREQDEAVRGFANTVAREPGDFSLPGAVEPDIYYNSRVEWLLGAERLERFALADIGCDETLGRPDKYPGSAAEFAWYLRGLDIVDQMMAWVLESDREELEGGIARIERISIAPAPKQRRRRAAEPSFVTGHAVEFTIVGHPIGISFLLKKLAVEPDGGRFLTLEDATVESLDSLEGQRRSRRDRVDPRDKGRVRARLRVAALDVRLQDLSGEETE